MIDGKLSAEIKEFFQQEFAQVILDKLTDGHSLSSFNVNPFMIIALSSGVLGKTSGINLAKALLYPRVFGTSISTSFGDRMQKLCTSCLNAQASSTPGMDIEFDDKVEQRKVVLQLKSGPNTINSGDVNPIVSEMATAYRLLQQNKVKNMPTFAVGIVYGSLSDINGNYKKVNKSSVGAQMEIPIYIGQDFWARLTGSKTFYLDLIGIFMEIFKEADYSGLFQTDIENLAREIEEKYFTKDHFDITKV